MNDRREFLRHSAAGFAALYASSRDASAAWPMTPFLSAPLASAQRVQGGDVQQLAADERFWANVRRAYVLNPDVLNLDHGWSNPAPKAAVDVLAREARALQALPAEELERIFFRFKTGNLRPVLAEMLGVPAEQVAVVRNATEALNTVLLGLPLRAGDEIVCSAHDYFAMLDALEQRQARDGVVLRMVRPPLPASTVEALAEPYETAIGARTKLVLLTHPSNLTGQLLPVSRIAAAAHRVGAEVVVDGAQSFGVLSEPITSFDCDYYGASAHKWLGAPIGVGVLWMRTSHPGAIDVWQQARTRNPRRSRHAERLYRHEGT